MDWLPRLKQRKLVQWLVAYCAGSWALLQVLDFLSTQFDWPSFIVRTLVIMVAVGVVAVLVVAWFHGERGEQRVPPMEIALLLALLILGGAGAFAFRIEPDKPSKAAIASIAEDRIDTSALAVLPFRNLSGDPAQEFFSDGFTEELSSALAAVEGLRVVAPSAFEFKGKEDDVRALAIEAGALYMLEGSVRRSTTEVRVTSKLVDTRNNRILWAKTFDRQLAPANVLAVQEQITRAIVSALEIAIAPTHAEPPRILGTNNQEAHDAYLRGIGALSPVTRESNAIAAREFERAIALDSTFARAHAGLAFAYAGYLLPRPTDPRRETILKQARRAALRALELDSMLADPHVVLANLSKNAREGRAHLDTAIRKDPVARWPRLARAYLWLAVGERRRGIAEIDQLLELDPLSPWSHIMAANIRNLAGQYARADSALDRADRLAGMGFGPYPQWPLHWNRGYAAIMRDDFETAARHFRNAYMPEFANVGKAAATALTRIAEVYRTEPDTAARRRKAVAAVQAGKDMQTQIAAMILLRLGAKDAFYEFLEQGPKSGDIFWDTAVYDSLRKEPRFIELSKRLQKPSR